jgi:hypothetical protein
MADERLLESGGKRTLESGAYRLVEGGVPRAASTGWRDYLRMAIGWLTGGRKIPHRRIDLRGRGRVVATVSGRGRAVTTLTGRGVARASVRGQG